MLLHALYERLCTAPLNRLLCYGALEVIVTLLLLLLLVKQKACWGLCPRPLDQGALPLDPAGGTARSQTPNISPKLAIPLPQKTRGV